MLVAMHDYMRLEVAKRARAIVPLVYRITARFPRCEEFVLTRQIRSATHSIGATLAEGAGRNTSGEFRQFVGYAIGSAYELEWHCVSADQLGYLTPADKDELMPVVIELKKMLYGFRESLG